MRIRQVFAAALAVLFCFSAAWTAEKQILRIFTWSDYFADQVLAGFEERYNCEIAIDLFDSNEIMLEEMTNPVAGQPAYDIITPSSYMMSIMRRRNMLSELDLTLIPNLPNIDDKLNAAVEDPNHIHSIPYARTISGIGYNKERLPYLEESWGIFANPELSGKSAMLDDMREVIGAALKYLGFSLNSVEPSELAKAEAQIMLWQKNMNILPQSETDLGLSLGEYNVVHGYSGDIGVLMQENPELGFFVPKEGASITSDDFVIPTGSTNRELAHAFINYLLDPVNAAVNMERTLYFMPIPDALARLSEKTRSSSAFAVPDEVLAKCEPIRDVGKGTRLYESVWAKVTNTR